MFEKTKAQRKYKFKPRQLVSLLAFRAEPAARAGTFQHPLPATCTRAGLGAGSRSPTNKGNTALPLGRLKPLIFLLSFLVGPGNWGGNVEGCAPLSGMILEVFFLIFSFSLCFCAETTYL